MAGPDDDGVTDEMLDVVEPTGKPVSRQRRSIVHACGLWHQVFHCLVVRSGLPVRMLLQRRHRSARAFAGMLDLSVTGHLLAGEQPLDGVRELREEMGLSIDASRLISLGRRLLASDDGEGRNREIAHVYLLNDDTPLHALLLDDNEVAGYVEIDVDDLFTMLADPSAPVAAVEIDTARVIRHLKCTGAELVPALDSYWIALATVADRWARGVPQLGI